MGTVHHLEGCSEVFLSEVLQHPGIYQTHLEHLLMMGGGEG